MLRKAKVSDVVEIQKLINFYADRGEMLPRSLNEIYENLRDYFVVEENGEIVGCCALHVCWEDLAEIKSLAVVESRRGEGWGKKLLEACLADAMGLGLPKVFALTFIPEFFERNGFRRVDKSELPQKVWGECIRCVYFPNCSEEAVVYQF